jgi:hypothetical protein
MRYVWVGILTCLLAGNLTFAWEKTTSDTVETHFGNGQLREQYRRVNYAGYGIDYKYGQYRSWFVNGQMESTGHYAKDGKIGVWTRWDSTGRLVEEINYLDGKRNGAAITWKVDGTVETLLQYKNDKLHGRCTWFASAPAINGLISTPNLLVDSSIFYLDGVRLVPLESWVGRELKPGEISGNNLTIHYFNPELHLWVEPAGVADQLYVGKKDSKGMYKQGVWTVYAMDGSMIRQDFYKDDHIMCPEK